MCECAQCIIIEFFDIILSAFIYVLNGVAALWGLILPSTAVKEDINKYVAHLETYVNIISYSDVILIPLKLVLLVVMKWCLCDCRRAIDRMNDTDDVIKQHENKDITDICTVTSNGCECNRATTLTLGDRGSRNSIPRHNITVYSGV